VKPENRNLRFVALITQSDSWLPASQVREAHCPAEITSSTRGRLWAGQHHVQSGLQQSRNCPPLFVLYPKGARQLLQHRGFYVWLQQEGNTGYNAVHGRRMYPSRSLITINVKKY